MEVKDIVPSDSYKELKFQFNAMKALLISKQAEVNFYREQMARFKFDRIIELEAKLESEKEMNAILTKELEDVKRN
jgi:hypothetical protein